MKPTPQQIEAAATAIANARCFRRGSPLVVNILEVLPPHLRSEVLLDGEAAAEAVLSLISAPTDRSPLFPEEATNVP